MSPDELLDGFDTNGVLGRLTEIPESSHNRLFQQALKDAQDSLELAKKQANETSRSIALDASVLSGVNGFDTWMVKPWGKVQRKLEPFELVTQQLARPSLGRDNRSKLIKHQPIDSMRLFARIAYNGLWSPSGTNWQPIRTVVLNANEASSLFGISISTQAMVVLTRKKYSSILGDIAGLCGIAHDPHAEYIDLGIWLQIAHHTAKGHGWTMAQVDIYGKSSKGLVSLLRDRSNALIQRSKEAALELASSLETGQHIPTYVLYPESSCELPDVPAAAARLHPSQFDQLIEARSTQRVASPSGRLSQQDIKLLWSAALEEVSMYWTKAGENLKFICFPKDHPVPAAIGEAMHHGIEGSNGLMSRIQGDNLRANLPFCPDIDHPIRPQSLPEHIHKMLTKSGQYHMDNKILVDHRGKPLTPARLVKLLRMLAKSFGRFFLSFHNTHPVLGIIMVHGDLNPSVQVLAYECAGRIAAHMTALARARGWVSIIKSGPVEIARAELQQLIAKSTKDRDEAQTIKTGKLRALLTFQVGLPLGPYELVSAGLEGQHNGLLERKLDKRAGRASISRHHIPL